MFLVKHVRHRSFFELATVKRKNQAKKGVSFSRFSGARRQARSERGARDKCIFPRRACLALYTRSVLRSPEKREKSPFYRLENKHLSL